MCSDGGDNVDYYAVEVKCGTIMTDDITIPITYKKWRLL